MRVPFSPLRYFSLTFSARDALCKSVTPSLLRRTGKTRVVVRTLLFVIRETGLIHLRGIFFGAQRERERGRKKRAPRSRNKAAASASDDTNIARCILSIAQQRYSMLQLRGCSSSGRRFHLRHKSGTLRGNTNTKGPEGEGKRG